MSTATDPRPTPLRRIARTLRRTLALVLLLVLIARVTGAAETLAYWPSREPFDTRSSDEDVWITTPDGLRLHAWFMHARGLPPGTKAPAVLHVHGNAGNVASHDDFSRFLTDAGFTVLIFDYRGYGRSDDATMLGRRALLRDTEAALAHLLARDDVDADRVGVLGVSLGGAFALRASADEPRVRAVATLSAFSSWQGVANDAAPVLGWLLFPSGVDGVDSVRRLGDRPLLVMHGLRDPVVSPRHAEVLARAARDAGVPVEVWTDPEGDHNTMVPANPEACAVLRDFFRRTLAAPDTP